MKILIVDDKPVNLDVLRTQLEAQGHVVVEASDGLAALAQARQSPPQLIISDLLMPGMDGYTLLRQWKADAQLREIPFIIYTATYTEPGDEKLARNLGADAFLLKPANAAAFRTAIAELVGKAARHELESPRAPDAGEPAQLREYNEVLIRKLEEKALQLATTNREMELEIVERKQGEAIIVCQAKVLELIALGSPLAETLTAMLESMEAFAPDMLCSVVLLDADGVHVRHGAAPSLPDAFNRAIEGQPIGPSAGSCGTAAFRREPVFVEDIATDPLWKDYRALAETHGLRACWSTPILDEQGTVLGTFAIYYRQPGMPTPRHRRCIDLATHLAAVAIVKHRDTAAIRASEARLRAIFDNEPECVKLLAADGSLQEMNPAGLRMIEADTYQQVANHCVYPLIVEEHRADFRALTERVFAGKSGYLEFQITGLKGGRRWLETHASPLRDESGRVVSLLGIARDITDRKQAAAANLQAQQLNKSLLESITDGVVAVDADWRYLLVNRRAEEMLGRTSAELVGQVAWEVFPTAKGSPVHQAGDRVLWTGVTEHLDQFFEDWGRWYENHLYRSADGLTIIFRDITDRKQAEAAARDSAEHLSFVIEGTGTGLWDWDLATNTVSYSREWKRMLGYTELEVADHLDEWKRLTHPEDVEPTLIKVGRFLAGAVGAMETEFRMRHKDGSWHWILSRATASLGPEGRPTRMVGLHTDITARKHAEQSLNAAHRRAQALAAVGSNLAEAVTNKAAAHAILQAADDLLGWDCAWLELWDPQEGCFESVLNYDLEDGKRVEFAPAAQRGLQPTTMALRVMEEGAQLVLRRDDADDLMGFVPFGSRRRSLSLLFAPIRSQDQLIGIVSVQSYRAEAYDAASLDLLQSLATHCAGALDRIRGRTELERQRAELELILDTAPGIIFYKDREHRLVRVNEAHGRALGRPRAEIEGRTDAELGSPHEAHYIRDDEEVMRTGQPKMGIIEPMHTAAGTRWLQTDKLPYRDAEGNIIGILGFALDITERKEAEEALREKEQLLSESQRIAHIGSWKYLLDGAILWSEETYRIFGVSSDSFTPRRETFFELILPEDRPAKQEWMQQCMAGAAPGEVDFRTRRPDGQIRHLRGRGELVCDAEGKPLYLTGTVQDITERKAAEEALARQHALLTAVIEGTTDAVFAKDLDGRYLIVNSATARAIGRPAAEIIGRTDGELLPPETALRFRETDAAVIAAGRAEMREEVGQMPDGLHYWLANKAPMRDAGGRIIGVVGVSRDITERKRAEAEVVKLSGTLLRAQDEERRRLARELHDSTAQTLSALAMNLAIVSRTSALDAEGRALLAECEAQVKRGTTELRTFAYLLHPPMLEALGLARAAQDYTEGFAKRSGIAVTLDLPDHTDRLPHETELTLFRVLQESLGNLHRHSGSTTAHIRITHDAESVTLEVRDAGRGLDDAQRAAVTGGVGVGVGFAGMRERLRLLGGRLEIEAGLPGLIVRATLPLADEKKAEA